jgi:hypothetical protein
LLLMLFEGPIGHRPLSILTGEWFCRRFPYQYQV